MGNHHPRPIKFRQSLNDFPLTVSLGEKAPSWGLFRWNSEGLRFVSPDDEGFTLRGDTRRLVYKGRRRSHRFTILGNGAFEYDCILEREPESNVISLLMEGAEGFDFLRQPDFVKDPFLKGSYAVYKKETLLGEGTGKLCHIHRPEIIDARGRRCWGELSIAGNELHITIPEIWLSEAAYPVIVDPTIGTTTIGSQTHWDNVDNESYDQLFIEVALALNRFLISETLNGTATAYVYAYEKDSEDRCIPVLYSDNNNIPLTRRSMSEGSFDIDIKSGKPAGWRSTTFKTNTSIASGTYIWFGLFCDWFAPRFDFGSKCYWAFWDLLGTDIPNSFPVWSADWYYNFKLSMYFSYTSAQNYVRTLTQGVKLADTRILTGAFKRTATQTVNPVDARKLTGAYKRTSMQTVNCTMVLGRLETFCRECLMNVSNSTLLFRSPVFIRSIFQQITAAMGVSESREFLRNCIEDVKPNTETKRSQGFSRKAQDGIRGTDTFSFPVLFLRILPETAWLADSEKHWGTYVRGLAVEAAIIAETRHGGEYYRLEADTVQAQGSIFRGLLIFVRLLTVSFVRDFIIRRFLKSNEELILKSCICREIILDSNIH